MKFWSLCLLATACLLMASPASATESLRVLCWNIQHGKGMDDRIDLERIAALISKHEPDIVMLQEVDHSCRRSGSVDQAAEIARLTGLHHAFGKAMDHDGGQYGQALLSRWPLEEAQVHRLPSEGEPRIAFSARVDTPLGRITISTLHLDHRGETRRHAQAQVVAAELLKSEGPVVLAGDLNDVPGSRTLDTFQQAPWHIIQKNGQANTFPADEPRREIDHFIVRGLRAMSPVQVIDERVASDHRPLLVVLGKPE